MGVRRALEEQPEQRGGGSVYDWLLEELEPLLRQAGGGGGRRRLYLTGHSIGAALASIFAQFLHTRSATVHNRGGGRGAEFVPPSRAGILACRASDLGFWFQGFRIQVEGPWIRWGEGGPTGVYQHT